MVEDKDWREKLMEKYPDLFRQKDMDMKYTCMCWGLECGDGWQTLLEALFFQIHHAQKMCKFDVVITQVKEKFGTLRVYWNTAETERQLKEGYAEYTEDYISGLICMAEEMSGCICEVCGDKGKIYDDGWVTTRCEKHAKS